MITNQKKVCPGFLFCNDSSLVKTFNLITKDNDKDNDKDMNINKTIKAFIDYDI
jgi:hypothetical protein